MRRRCIVPRPREPFDKRMRELSERVGEGNLTGTVEVDQVYARYQHEGLDLNHPEGGQAKYLEAPLYADHNGMLERLAGNVLEGDLEGAMIDNMEGLSNRVYELAPFEFGDLKASGHPKVTNGDEVAYDRPPNIHRLTPLELEAKAELRALGLGN